MADKNLSLGTIFTGHVDQKWKDAIKKMEAGLASVAAQMNAVNVASGGAKTAMSGFTTTAGEATKAAKKLSGSTEKFNKQISSVEGAYSKFLSALKVTAAYGAASMLIMGMVTAFKAGIKEIIDYDQALKNLEAITGASSSQVAAMGNVMKGVAEITKFSTGEVAQGMVLLGQAGFSAAEAMDAIQPTANLATGTLTSMQTTADLLTTTIRAFSLSTVEAGRVSDVMANAVNKSKLTVDKLRIAFNFVGAAAAQTGLSLEETAGSMMVLANSGLRASTIGTGLRQVLSRLLAPTGKLKSAFESHGIALDKVNPSLVGYQKAMKNLLPVVWDNVKGAVDMGKAYQLFGLRGAQAMAVLARSFVSGEFKDMLDKTYQYGTAARMAAIQAEGLGVMLKNLSDRFKLVAIAVGEAGLTGIMRGFLNVLKGISVILKTGFESRVGSVVTQFVLWSVAVKGVIAALSFFTVGRGAALLGYFAKMRFLFTGWTAAIVATIVYLYQFTTTTDRAIKKLGALAVETEKTVANLQLYSGVLKSLNESKKKNANYESEYIANLQRLREAVPELKNQIELSTEAYGENQAAIEELLKVKLKEQIEVNTELIKKNNEYLKTAATRLGFFAWASRQATLALGYLVKGLDDAGKMLGQLISWLFRKMADIWDKFISESPKVGAALKLVFGDIGKILRNFAEDLSKLGKDAPKFTKMLEDQNALMRDVGVAMRMYGHSVKEVRDHLNSIKGTMPDKEFEKLLVTVERLYKRMKEGPGGVDDMTPEQIAAAAKVESDAKIRNQKAYYSLLASLETDDVQKTKWAYQEKLEAIKKWHKEAVELAKKMPSGAPALDTRKMDALAKANARRTQLELKAEESRDAKLYDIQLKRTLRDIKNTELVERQKLEIKKKNAAENATVLSKLKEEEEQLTVDMLAKIVKAYEVWFAEATKGYSIDSEEYKNALAIKEKATLDYVTGERSLAESGAAERIKIRKKELKYLLEHSQRTGQEYVKLLDEAYDLNLLSFEEHLRKKKAAQESWLANFRFGLEESFKKMQTFTEMFQELGSQIVDKIAGDLTSGFWDFAEGTKTAKEAFADFAKSTIRWIGEIILKQQIMNAMMTLMGGMTPGGSWGGYANDTRGGTGVWHKGGIVGVTPAPVRIVNPNIFANAKRYHSGLKSDEFPAILQKGEEVIPKGGSSGNVTVNVINKSGQNLNVTQKEQRFDADEMILDVVVDAANRNKRGFRDNMRGLLR